MPLQPGRAPRVAAIVPVALDSDRFSMPDRDAPLVLYDLSKDLHEDHDVAARHPDVVKKIEAYLKVARTPSKDWPLLKKPIKKKK